MVELRQWQMEDVHTLSRLQTQINKKQLLRTLFASNTFLRTISLIQFYQQADPDRFLYRAIVCDGQVCGYVQADKRTSSSAEIGYWLLSEYRGQGIMSSIIDQLCETIYQQLHVLAIYANVEQDNIPSQRLLQHHGFQLRKTEGHNFYLRYR